jgi:hypothetical protein
MNPFLFHHQKHIRFSYSCFDRIICNAIIQRLQMEPAIVCFLEDVRKVPNITKSYLRSLAADYHVWVKKQFHDQRGVAIVNAKDIEEDRRENWVEDYYQQRPAREPIAVILRSREGSRILLSHPTSGKPHLELKQRFVDQYYFYLDDHAMGRMWIRVCPYFPFNCRVYVNSHEWLARRMRQEGIPFRQCGNAFLDCADPQRLQELSDTFAARDVITCVHRWLAQLVPFFTAAERRDEGFGYRLFVSQVEYCTNLIFDERAALDNLSSRLLDVNRTIGRPDKITYIYGKRRSPKTVAGLKTRISDYHWADPAIRSEFRHSSIKDYVRDHRLFRVENTSNCTYDFGINKGIDNLPALRDRMKRHNDRYLEVQQDILETFVDRGQLQQLRQPTMIKARRVPGLKLDDERLLAVMSALVRFAPLAVGGRFRTRDVLPFAAKALGLTTEQYTLTKLRYDLAKLRAKNLVHKVQGTQNYELTAEGYRLCVFFLKVHQRLLAPIVAGTVHPIPEDERLPVKRRCPLDRLYTAVDSALHAVYKKLGLKLAG